MCHEPISALIASRNYFQWLQSDWSHGMVIGSKKNLYPENGNANGGETPSGQRRNVLVYRLL